MKNWTFALLLGLSFTLGINQVSAQDKGGPNQEDAEFRAYCDQTLRVLERARGQASMAAQNGNFEAVVDILINGLRQTANQTYGDLNPITLRLITHGHNLGLVLNHEVARDVKGLKATAIALEAFYDVIFNTAHRIDYQYYRCRNRWFGCGYSRTMEFERNMLEMVRDMLTLPNTTLVYNRGYQRFPLGPSSAYLVAAEVISGAAYTEMTQLLYSTSYSCEILDLKYVWQDLGAFNRSNMDEMSKRQKIDEVYYSLEQIISGIHAGSCR